MKPQLRYLYLVLSALYLLLLPLHLQAQTGYVPSVGDKITTDDGIFVVSGTNLITNPNFDDGFAGWKAGNGSELSEENFTIDPEGGPDGSPCIRALKTAGSGSAQSIKTGWAVEEGKTYLFSCWAKRASSAMSSNTQYSRIFASSSETSTDTELKKINFKADTWVQTEYVFTASQPYLVANFGWLNSATSFDCFYLGEVTVSNELATTKLEDAIAAAQNTLDTTEEGTAKGQYSSDVRATLAAAIATAQSVLLSATTQEQINNAVTTLNAAVSTYQNSVNPPFEQGVGYVITNVASGLNLSTADGTVRIKTPDGSDPKQEFYFVPAPEGSAAQGYNIVSKEGVYIYRSGSWDTKASADADVTLANAIFEIVDMGDYVQLKNRGSGSVLGTDSNSDNSAVYSNKNGTNERYCWTLMRNTPTAALESAIENAKAVLAGAEIGSEYWQVPQSAYDALNQAISDAEATLATITTQEESAAAVTTLNTAVATFNQSYNPLSPFNEGETYIVKHYGGNLLTTTETGNASVTTKPEEGATQQQLMTFVKANVSGYDNVYYLQSQSDYRYLARTGDWNTTWQASNDTLAAVVSVEKLDGKWLGIKFISTQTYLGTDATTSGSLTYSDKAGKGYVNSYWTIEPYVTVLLDRVAWNEALLAAQNALENAKEGYGLGDFFEADITAFRNLIATARSNANKAQDQETLNAVTAQLKTDTETFLGKAHTEQLIDKRELTKAITAAQTATSAAVAGDLDGQYPQTAIDNYKAALTSALGVADNAAATQEQVDAATQTLKDAAATFAAVRVKIDYTALRQAIADAQQVLTEAKNFIGEGPGKYPQSAYDALNNVLTEAQNMVKNNDKNQTTVDGEVNSLQTAVTTFLNSRQANNTAELQTLIDEATQLLANADAGQFAYVQEDYDALLATLANAKNLLTSTVQDDIDRMAKVLQRDIDIFKTGMEEMVGITAIIPLDSRSSTVYDLTGRKLNHLSKGLYIINGKKVIIK